MSLKLGKIGLVGPGAIGGYYGGMLAHAGQDVHFYSIPHTGMFYGMGYSWSTTPRAKESRGLNLCRLIKMPMISAIVTLSSWHQKPLPMILLRQ